MVIGEKTVTVEAFMAFVLKPENADKRFELINGRIVEVVSNNRSSELAAYILGLLVAFVYKHKLGRVTGADGGYIVAGNRYIPDAAFITIAKQPQPCTVPYNPQAPDIAVEVLSPTDNQSDVRLKISNYLLAGTTLWLVNPDSQQIEVYQPGQQAVVLDMNSTLSGGQVLPGFSVPVREIFEI